ncbi:branched-chain amino acid ABC transporter permease [Chloroflexus sp.]|uniref:branched-chain amino acid ABC transporter permease n=1 Tax=Chloroflexus sp. TaxID=1904827 RepID=UPI002ADD8F4C|nr:branched-chain amino acid ABC transporter permease [Chloroflexus sp.]
MLTRLKAPQWAGLALIGGLIAFPYLIALLTGQPIDSGVPKFWQGMLIQVFILAVFAMSYDILMGYTGILSFGHALFFGTGAYTIGILLKHAGWDLGSAFVAVIVIAILQSLIVGLLSLRVSGVYFAMVTLAFAQMFFLLAEATDFRQWTGAEDGLQSIPVPAWISPTNERLRFYYLALGFAVVMYLLARQVVNSPTGRVMMAIRDNEVRARVLGYHTLTYKLIAITVSGVMAALAGAFNALWNLNANPAVLSVGTTINALLMTIIGGVGSLIGPMLGAAVIQLLGYWLNFFFGPAWPLLFGIVYILIVLFLPYGIVGTWRLRGTSWVAMWRSRWQELARRRGDGMAR